ncbi:MAG: DUF11 domain-containing protein [Candidatus Marinimicrobia bacterium]|nr:DUF11 domain-containing protein [Candidatus Neomarinimicrobiota bacterium]
MLILLGVFLPFEGLLAASWPLESEWIPMVDVAWSPLQDANDQRKGYTDIIVDDDGNDSYFYCSESTIYIRIVLQETPLKRGSLNFWTWFAALDVDGNDFPDWAIIADGWSEELSTSYNSAVDEDPELKYYSIENPISSGEIRIVELPNYVYLDFQVPFSALQLPGYENNISLSTPFRMFFGTAKDANLSFSDLSGNFSSISEAFSNVPPIARGQYGSIYDTRDPAPFSNEGLWTSPEVISLQGEGWPISSSAYFNAGVRRIRIVDSHGELAWYGSVTSDGNGTIAPVDLWTLNNSASAGTYTITVENPIHTGVYYAYDTFTVTVPPPTVPEISILKIASSDTAEAETQIQYTITISNTGTGSGLITEVRDILPPGFTYVPGSSSGFTTIDPVSEGASLIWYGNWTVNPEGTPPNSISLTFSATVGSQSGDFLNAASILGSNFDLVETGPTAQVTVTAPEPGVADLTVSCTASVDSAVSSSLIDYKILIANSGTAAGIITLIQDDLPIGFSYVPGTTSGLTTADPVVSDSRLIWEGEWTVSEGAGSNIDSLVFTVTVPQLADKYFNSVTIGGPEMSLLSTGSVAPVQVLVPHLTLAKSVDNGSSFPGDTLSYTVTYLNIGSADAKLIIISESIPANTIYLENSASGESMSILFSHDGGFTYNSDQTAPVTSIQYQRSLELAPLESGSVRYKVLVR